MTQEEFAENLAHASSTVKLICGVGNNAAWMCCLEALDKIKGHRRYKHRVKKEYKDAVREYHAYENRLIYAETNRFFRVDDMLPDTRKRYAGDITDRDYYDFWASTGAVAYQQTRPLVTSLQNKYRLSLIQHEIEQPDLLSWAMTASAALAIAVKLYNTALEAVNKDYRIPMKILTTVFCNFSLAGLRRIWERALVDTEPKLDYELSSVEVKNISWGIEQLSLAWLDLKTVYGSTVQTVSDYSEVFRTRGEQKKAMREIAEVQAEAEKELSERYS